MEELDTVFAPADNKMTKKAGFFYQNSLILSAYLSNNLFDVHTMLQGLLNWSGNTMDIYLNFINTLPFDREEALILTFESDVGFMQKSKALCISHLFSPHIGTSIECINNRSEPRITAHCLMLGKRSRPLTYFTLHIQLSITTPIVGFHYMPLEGKRGKATT